MNGIQGLMPQGQPIQVPGQAMPPGQRQPMMPGMQPGMGGAVAGISPQTPMLEKLSLDQLKQLYIQSMMPGSNAQVRPYAILSAISKKAQEAKLMQAIQNSSAQEQNAYQQGIGSIAEQVLQQADDAQEPVMAKHGGEMNGYAGGGIVAFAEGDAVWRKRLLAAGVPESFIAELEARGAGREQIESDARRAGYMGAQTSPVAPPVEPLPPVRPSTFFERVKAQHAESPISQALLSAADKVMKGEPVVQGPLLDRPAIETLADVVSPPPPRVPSFAGKSGDPNIDTGPAQAAPQVPPPPRENAAKVRPRIPDRGPAVVAAPAKPITADDQELQNYLSALRTRQGLPEDVASGRAGIEALVGAEMKARQERLAQDRAAAEERRKEALERAPSVFSPEGLLGIAASIDPRRGYELGSAARGAFGIMGAQRKAQEEARKEFREFEKAERTEQNLLSQMRILEAQRKLAVLEGDAKTANELTDKIYATRREIEKFNAERAEKKRQLDIQELAAQKELEEARAKGVQSKAQLESLDLSRKQAAVSNAQARLVNLIDKRKEVVAGILGPFAAMYQMDEKKFAETNPEKYKEVKNALVAYDKDIAAARVRLDAMLTAADDLPPDVVVKKKAGT